MKIELFVLGFIIANFAQGISEDEIRERYHYRGRRQNKNHIAKTVDNAELDGSIPNSDEIVFGKGKECVRCKRHYNSGWHQIPENGNVGHFTHRQPVMSNIHRGNRNSIRNNRWPHHHHHHHPHHRFTHNCEWHQRHRIPMPSHSHCTTSSSTIALRLTTPRTTPTTTRITSTTTKTTTARITPTTTTTKAPTITTTKARTTSTTEAPKTTTTEAPTTTTISVFCNDLINPRRGDISICDQETATSNPTTEAYWNLFNPRRFDVQYDELDWITIK